MRQRRKEQQLTNTFCSISIHLLAQFWMLQTGKSLQSKNYLQSYDNLHHIYNNIGPGAQNSAHTYWRSINAAKVKK